MTNEEWRQAYRQGYRDGREDTKKEMNYQNFPPVYYGGASVKPDSRSAVMGTPAPGGYAVNKINPNEYFVTGMSVDNMGYGGC